MSDLQLLYQQQVNMSDSGNASLEVSWLMEDILGVSKVDIQTKQLADFENTKQVALHKALAQYHEGKPLAYILGTVPFGELDFLVAEGVLIPREDTLFMVEEISARLRPGDRIIELGVGSGAIICTLAAQHPNVECVGIDQCIRAIDLAQRNVDALGVAKNVNLYQACWYQPLDFGQFDWVICNPPYIAIDDPAVSSKVRTYEPESAWASEDSGFADIKHVINISRQLLTPGGMLAIEHGYLQQEQVVSLLQQSMYTPTVLGSDENHPRFVVASVTKGV